MAGVAARSLERHLLRFACRLWRLQTGFTNTEGEWVEASAETLKRLLSAVSGREIAGADSYRELIHEARARRIRRRLEPVHVIWTGEKASSLSAILPQSALTHSSRARVELENGEVFPFKTGDLKADRQIHFDGENFARVRIPVPRNLPTGYHKFVLEIRDEILSTRLFCAQPRVGEGAPEARRPRWGLFSPLYAITSARDWGIGDLGEMAQAQEFIRSQGGAFFGTLPLLPISCESSDCDPSPYSPVSRLFWNEVYLDVDALVHESKSSVALKHLQSEAFQKRLRAFRSSALVEYGEVFEAKKEILQILADEFFEAGEERRESFRSFLKERPEAESYAEFRSKGAESERRYHLFTQYQMDKRLRHLRARSDSGELAGLYLDFPVGVSRSGFDSSFHSSSFLTEANAGAPPDQLFLGGQDWGFAPLHPIRERERGYSYFIRCLRHHMRFASYLRLDHIMAFHRIYAIPQGMKPKEGAYIRYCPEEFYALLSIEAERAGVRVVGEDLGTVPQEVRDALKNHDCLRMWVLPFEAAEQPTKAVQRVPERSLACMNTHDMVPFAGYWSSEDLKILDELGILEPGKDAEMKEDRKRTIEAWTNDVDRTDAARQGEQVLLRLLELLSASPAEMVVINIEDLWGEEKPQNVPGTWKEYPNWRRKLKVRLEDWTSEPGVIRALRTIAEARARAERRQPHGGAHGSQYDITTDEGRNTKAGTRLPTDHSDSGGSAPLQ